LTRRGGGKGGERKKKKKKGRKRNNEGKKEVGRWPPSLVYPLSFVTMGGEEKGKGGRKGERGKEKR